MTMLKKMKHTMKRGLINKENLKAVHDDDLEGFLKNISLYQNITSGKTRCKFCGEKITISNLYAVFPDSGTINVVCNNKSCIPQFLDYSGRVQ